MVAGDVDVEILNSGDRGYATHNRDGNRCPDNNQEERCQEEQYPSGLVEIGVDKGGLPVSAGTDDEGDDPNSGYRCDPCHHPTLPVHHRNHAVQKDDHQSNVRDAVDDVAVFGACVEPPGDQPVQYIGEPAHEDYKHEGQRKGFSEEKDHGQDQSGKR